MWCQQCGEPKLLSFFVRAGKEVTFVFVRVGKEVTFVFVPVGKDVTFVFVRAGKEVTYFCASWQGGGMGALDVDSGRPYGSRITINVGGVLCEPRSQWPPDWNLHVNILATVLVIDSLDHDKSSAVELQ